ncbi:hypothetical protein GGR57DRAFT_479870 [Xylariaceae sp. FL1272]|nr:hypothetical protein GGR57DRAFT_479870 [Xylariaceae sp. FL1272]
MAFEVYKDRGQWVDFLTSLILSVICIIAVVLRFIATRKSHRKPSLEDWLALLALVAFLENTITAMISNTVANGMNILVLLQTRPEEFVRLRQYTYASLFGFYFSQTFTKLSILALYYRIFSTSRAYARWIIFFAAVQTAWLVTFVFVQIYQCRPIRKFWLPLLPGYCTDEGTMIVIVEVPNSLLDFALVILSIIMIRPLQMTTATKWKLRSIFGLGAIAGVIGFVKIGITYAGDPIYAFSILAIIANFQQAAGLICCCAPVYKPILPSGTFWNQILSKISLSSSQSRKQTTDRDIYPPKRQSEEECLADARYAATGDSPWSPTNHGVEVHALRHLPSGEALDGMPGTIHITRSVDIA